MISGLVAFVDGACHVSYICLATTMSIFSAGLELPSTSVRLGGKFKLRIDMLMPNYKVKQHKPGRCDWQKKCWRSSVAISISRRPGFAPGKQKTSNLDFRVGVDRSRERDM